MDELGQLTRFIADRVELVDLQPDTPLVSSGIVDSFEFAGFVDTLCARYDIHLDLSDLGADNFDTPRQMLEVIEGLRHTQRA